ncbi:MAG: TIGR03960 family B12-binding radical SAM protein [Bacillota bacterium]
MEQKLKQLLSRVQKPARYVGGEWNSVTKDWDQTDFKTVFAFPDVYEVGMSHLGLQILYSVVNSRDDLLMERVFAPWPDMELLMRENSLPLFSLESGRPLGDFDLIGFTLQYELSFTNVLNMLNLSGLPLRSRDRVEGRPLVVAGGPCAFNPEPLAEFIDLFVIGEGEEVLLELIDACREKRGRSVSRRELLTSLARLPGVYVPSLYKPVYDSGGNLLRVEPRGAAGPAVRKRVVADLDSAPFPGRPIVPNLGVVHDRMVLEVQRGCTRGCRFCQAGVIYRPVREKSPATLFRQAEDLVGSTGWDEISLTSLSTADYSRVREVVTGLLDSYGGRRINVSLPSLRVDAFSVDLAREAQRVRKATLTFAPEAGTQRLRDVINKGVTGEDLLEAVSSAFSAGWHGVKLYFMIGLPTETDEDIEGIARLARLVVEAGERRCRSKGRLKVTVSVSSFVPKSHTPFQWEPQDSMAELRRKQQLLREKLRHRRIVFNYHDPGVSFLEAVLARGDRRLGDVLEEAWRRGARFDGWTEMFDYKRWQEAFDALGINPESYARRRFGYDDVLPWDHIDAGVSRKYLVQEHRQALEVKTTPDCRQGRCPGCGLCPNLEIRPRVQGGEPVVPLQD